VPTPFDTLTQYVAGPVSAGVMNVDDVASGSEQQVSPLAPAYH
jgi:hypothetical protein